MFTLASLFTGSLYKVRFRLLYLSSWSKVSQHLKDRNFQYKSFWQVDLTQFLSHYFI